MMRPRGGGAAEVPRCRVCRDKMESQEKMLKRITEHRKSGKTSGMLGTPQPSSQPQLSSAGVCVCVCCAACVGSGRSRSGRRGQKAVPVLDAILDTISSASPPLN